MVEHEIARIQVDDILPVGERWPINFPKIHSIKKHVKDFPPVEWEDRRTILEFINEFIKYFGEYLMTDEQKIPVFVEIVRNSPALTALTDHIELYQKECRRAGRKPIFQEICTMLIDRLWDK